MQIAKLFASLGFKIDTADLSHFESLLNKAQGEMSQFAKDINQANIKLKTMKSRFGQASDALNSSNVAKAADRVAKAVDKYVKNAKEIVDIDSKVEKVFLDTGVRLDTLSNKLDGGTAAWNRYEQQVKEATTRMREFTAAARERQSVNPPRSANSGSNTGGSNSGSRGGSRGNNGYNDEEEGFGAMLLGGQRFGRAFVGQMAFGGLLGSGYVVKEIIQAGREIQKMEQMLLQASKSTEDFHRNLEFVNRTSSEMKIDVESFGTAFSKILNATSASDLTQKQKEEMIAGISKYMRAVNLSTFDQAGIFKQIGQMFNLQRIQQEDLNTISERGLPMNKFLMLAAEKMGMTRKHYSDLQQKGQADPVKFLPVIAQLLSEAADNNDAYSKSLETSLAAQTEFTNALKTMSSEILKSGLDKALYGMFNALAGLVEIITPMIVGLIEAFKGLYLIFEMLLALDAYDWFLIVTLAVWGLGAALIAGGKAAIFAGGAVTFMASALRLLKAAVPIAALMGLLWVLGEVVKWRKEQEAGNQTYTWIDLWIVRAEFFFKLMKLGWLNTRISISESINAIQKFFTITPPKWFSDFIERKNSDPKNAAELAELNRQLNQNRENVGAMLTPSSFGSGQNLSIPVDVYLTIQNPDGSSYMARATRTPVINVGGLGISI